MSYRNRIIERTEVKAGDLTDHAGNWRVHPEAQRRGMVAILEEVGIVDALTVYRNDDDNLTIIDGHLRKNIDPAQMWPVDVLDVDDDEADKILATKDPLAAMAETERAQMEALMAGIEAESEAMEALLADIAEREGVVLNGDEAEDPGAEVDRAAELQEKWGTAEGQLWLVGRHRLLCGDALNGEDVERLLDGAKPNLLVTDPPYGVEYDANWRNEAAAEGKLAYAASRVRQVSNDDRIDWSDAYKLFPGSVAYTWSPPGDHVILTGLAIQKPGFEIRNQIIWVKPHYPISRGHYTYQHEPCWYAVRKGETADWIGPANASTRWEIALDKNVEGGHSTQKPVECMQCPIRNHEGDVYDPFVGSGTTIVAAEAEGRTAYAMDIDPAYVAVALERLAGMGLDCRLKEESL